MIRMLGHLTLSQRSLKLSSFLLIRFSFFLSDSFISTILSSTSQSYLLPLLFYYLFPPECFLSHLLHYYSIFKSRDITLPTKVCLVKAMVFPVVMYGCDSWTVKKAECQRIDTFELWCWRRLLRVP